MTLHTDLPEELIEHLEKYCDSRCPVLAGHLINELSTWSSHASSDDERCTFSSLLRHWLGVDHSRIGRKTALSLCERCVESKRWPVVSTRTLDSVCCRAVNDS